MAKVTPHGTTAPDLDANPTAGAAPLRRLLTALRRNRNVDSDAPIEGSSRSKCSFTGRQNLTVNPSATPPRANWVAARTLSQNV